MAEPPIEIDETRADDDSAYEQTVSTFTASLSSSVVDYPTEHGRRYHKLRAGAYPLPNDEPEMERLDFMHMLLTKALGEKLFLAPIDKGKTQRILDIGTGTGIWAMDMGDEYPEAEVLGNDLSAIQSSWVPPNVKFEVDDVESEWTFNQTFDFIFCRYMTACIKDWPKLVNTIFDNTTPGGWAEIQDFNLMYYSDDKSFGPNRQTYTWITKLLEASNEAGRDPCPGPKVEGWMRDAGFKNIGTKKVRLPIGPWPKEPRLKELGLFNITQCLEGLEAFSLRLYCNVLGWSEEEVLALCALVRNELHSGNMHCIYDFHVVYGQKPEDAPKATG